MNKLIYTKPAAAWLQALPVGNGSLGIMLDGGVQKETLYINDDTLWSGYPKDHTNKNSKKHLGAIRKLIFSGQYLKATALAKKTSLGNWSESYLPLGNVVISYQNANGEGYRRELDLKTAVHQVTSGGQTRTTFGSFPDQCAVHKVTSNQKDINAEIGLTSKLKHQVQVGDALCLVGNAPDYVVPNYVRTSLYPVRYNKGKGMAFALAVVAKTDGTVTKGKTSLTVMGASYLELYIVTKTGYQGFQKDPSTDRKLVLEQCLQKQRKIEFGYQELLERHTKDHFSLYDRAAISLGAKEEGVTTEVLYREAKSGRVRTELVELFYNYGRYLTIAGSRVGSQALNLQGIWNRSLRPPWSSNYTANINVQMNYWHVGTANLHDCYEPYVSLVKETCESGKHTARTNYGCGGFASNHNIDLWRKTTPVKGDPTYAYYPLGSAWLVNELYDHAMFQNDDANEAAIYDIIREATLFASEWLVEHEGHLVSCPSASPELNFLVGAKRASLDYATAFDMGMIRELYKNYLALCKKLDKWDALADTVQTQQTKLHPFGEGSTGLLEWAKDHRAAEPGHRHFSPLYALYPGREIGYYNKNEWLSAAKRLLDYRRENGSGQTGWSAGWAICLYARLHDGESAEVFLQKLLTKSLHPNLFGKHPPYYFQIDANFGGTAGINEMLLQTEDGVVELLPALPKAWDNGSVRGFCLRGGGEISFRWEKGQVVEVETSGAQVLLRAQTLAKNCKIKGNIQLQTKEEPQ